MEELRFRARADQLQGVRQRIRSLVEGRGVAADAVERIVLAVNEACMNIIQHAYKGDSTNEIVMYLWEEDQELVLRLEDFAAPVDKRGIKSRDLDDVRPGGIGVHLIQELMDAVTFMEAPNGAGNILELRKRIG